MKKLFTTVFMLGVALVSWATVTHTYVNGTLTVNYTADGTELDLSSICTDEGCAGSVTKLEISGDFTNQQWADKVNSFIVECAGSNTLELDMSGCSKLYSKFIKVEDGVSGQGQNRAYFDVATSDAAPQTYATSKIKTYYFKETGKQLEEWQVQQLQSDENGQYFPGYYNNQPGPHYVYSEEVDVVIIDGQSYVVNPLDIDANGNIKMQPIGQGLTFGNDAKKVIKAITFPNTAINPNFTFIPGGLFQDCTALTTVTLHNGIEALDNKAFWKVASLTSINFPNSIKAIGGDSFKDTSLTQVLLANTQLDKVRFFAFQDIKTLSEVSLPSTLKEIQLNAFQRSTLTSLDLSNCHSLEYIRNEAFDNCAGLSSVTFPDGKAENELKSIGVKAFGNSGIVIADMSNCHKLTLIDNHSFLECTSLTTVKVCSHPKVIKGSSTGSEGDGAFANCKAIKTVEVVGCQGTIMTECICENRAFDVMVTYHNTASAGAVEECARLIYPTGMAFDMAVKSAPNDYTSSYDWFVGNYKEGIHITQEDLQCYWKDVPLSGKGSAKVLDFDENGDKTGEHWEYPNLPKYAGNGWLEFLNVGSTVPIITDPKGRFLRTYSRTEGTGPALLPIGVNAINAYRVLDYKSTVPEGEDDIAGYLVLKKLEAVVDGTNYSYVPEETGVVLYSNFSFESAILSLAPYDGWQELQNQKVEGQENLTKLDQLLPKFKNTGAAYYDPNVSVDGTVNRLDANMLEGSYGNPAHLAPVFPWNWDTSSYGSPSNIKYRNFILSTKADSPADNPVYQWRRSKPGYLRDNRAYAQLPKSRFIYDDEQSSQMPLLEETENKLNSDDSGETQSMNVGFFFEGEEATGIITIDSKGNLVEDDAWYTLQGVKVAHPTKGVYIHNQKKVILK